MHRQALAHRAAGRARSTARCPDRAFRPTASLPGVMESPGNHQPSRRQPASRLRFSKNCEQGIDFLARRVYVHHKPNADGSNPRCGKPAERRWFGRKSRLSAFSFRRTGFECRYIVVSCPAARAGSAGRGDCSHSTSSAASATNSRPYRDAGSALAVKLAAHNVRCCGVNSAATLGHGTVSKNREEGIDILARWVYVHSVPEADGSNSESGRSAERRRVWGQTWSCRRSALLRSSRAGPSALTLLRDPRQLYTRTTVIAGNARPHNCRSCITP